MPTEFQQLWVVWQITQWKDDCIFKSKVIGQLWAKEGLPQDQVHLIAVTKFKRSMSEVFVTPPSTRVPYDAKYRRIEVD